MAEKKHISGESGAKCGALSAKLDFMRVLEMIERLPLRDTEKAEAIRRILDPDERS